MPVFGNEAENQEAPRAVSFDLSKVGEVAPDGDYPLVVRSATVRKSQAGNLYILVTSLINDPDKTDVHGVSVRTNIMLEADAMVAEIVAAQFEAILGYVPEAGEYTLTEWKELASEMIGNEFWASLKTSEWNGKERNEISYFLI